jgi:hypothetical protein
MWSGRRSRRRSQRLKKSPFAGGEAMLYRRFEQLIDVFRDAPTAAPPDRVFPFYT